MKYYCIINLSGLQDVMYSKLAPRPELTIGGDIYILRSRYAPTRFYTEKKAAVDELFRLQQRLQSQEFALFETSARVVQSLADSSAFHLQGIKDHENH